jgi:hypothetical protein
MATPGEAIFLIRMGVLYHRPKRDKDVFASCWHGEKIET